VIASKAIADGDCCCRTLLACYCLIELIQVAEPSQAPSVMTSQGIERCTDLQALMRRLLYVLLLNWKGAVVSDGLIGLCAVPMSDPRLCRERKRPVTEREFELVMLHQVRHLFSQSDRVIAEARRVLAPGGRLTIADLGQFAGPSLTRDPLARHRRRLGCR
jgi:SAM-dependent methyltransferase